MCEAGEVMDSTDELGAATGELSDTGVVTGELSGGGVGMSVRFEENLC